MNIIESNTNIRPISIQPITNVEFLKNIMKKVASFALQFFTWFASFFPLPHKPIINAVVTEPINAVVIEPSQSLIRASPVSLSFVDLDHLVHVKGVLALFSKQGRFYLGAKGSLMINQRELPINTCWKISRNTLKKLSPTPLSLNALVKSLGVSRLLSNQLIPTPLCQSIHYENVSILEMTTPFDERVFNFLALPQPTTTIHPISFEVTEDSIFEITHSLVKNSYELDCQATGSTYILSHIWKTLEGNRLNDRDEIAFKEGHITAQCASNQNLLFMHLLEATYGRELTQRVSEKHSLYTKTPLTWGDVKAAFIAIGANVNENDLRYLFSCIKENKSDWLIYNYLTNDEIASLSYAKDFNDLTPNQLHILISAFRTLPQDDLKVPTATLFAMPDLKDWKMLNICTRITSISADTPLALREMLAKEVAYLALSTGQIVPIFDVTGRLDYYTTQALPNRHDGMVGCFLTPLNCNRMKWDTDNPFPIELNFRGTQTSRQESNALESVGRDLEFCVGYWAFEARKEELMRMLLKQVNRAPKGAPVILNVNGHSLGGADVQRFIGLVTQVFAQSPDNSPLQPIIKMSAFIHNAPGLETSLNTTFIKNLKILEMNRPNFKLDLTYFYFETDPVQVIADPTYLGAYAKSDLLGRQVIAYSSDEIQGIAAHSARPLTNVAHGKLFKALLVTHEEALNSLMQGNLHFYRIKTGLTSILQYTIWAIFRFVIKAW